VLEIILQAEVQLCGPRILQSEIEPNVIVLAIFMQAEMQLCGTVILRAEIVEQKWLSLLKISHGLTRASYHLTNVRHCFLKSCPTWAADNSQLRGRIIPL
jgi:hypothetical protein